MTWENQSQQLWSREAKNTILKGTLDTGGGQNNINAFTTATTQLFWTLVIPLRHHELFTVTFIILQNSSSSANSQTAIWLPSIKLLMPISICGSRETSKLYADGKRWNLYKSFYWNFSKNISMVFELWTKQKLHFTFQRRSRSSWLCVQYVQKFHWWKPTCSLALEGEIPQNYENCS